MPAAKPLSKPMILNAMDKTLSNMAAARYLGCSYQHYKKFAKLYTNESDETLFDLHKNQSGKGIPKYLKKGKDSSDLVDIIEGRVPPSSFTPKKLKKRLFEEGYLEEQCSCCEFQERRVTDHKIPILLNFKDKNKSNYKLDNLEMLCYNCYFLQIGDIFNNKQVEQIEDNTEKIQQADWELDSYQQEMLDNLATDLRDETKNRIDPYNISFDDLISRK